MNRELRQHGQPQAFMAPLSESFLADSWVLFPSNPVPNLNGECQCLVTEDCPHCLPGAGVQACTDDMGASAAPLPVCSLGHHTEFSFGQRILQYKRGERAFGPT